MTNIPPHSRETEEALLGSLLIDPQLVKEINLEPEDFYIHRHRFIYEALRNSDKKLGQTDFLLVSNELDEMGYLEEIGGPAYLTELVGNVPTSLHAEQYAREIRDYAERRKAIEIAEDIAKNAFSGEMNWSHHIGEIQKSIRSEGGVKHIGELLPAYEEYMEARKSKDGIWGMPWPWRDMNRITGGIHRKRSIIVSGDTGIGKTVFMLQVGLHNGGEGYRVRIYELEMSQEDIWGRFVSMVSEISEWRMRFENKLSDYDKAKIQEAKDYIKTLPIYISDATHWTSTSIRADITKAGGCDLVIVDYLALLKDKAESDHQRMTIASRNLRDAAKDLNFALMSVSSEVKDGTIKGEKEAQYAQDEIFRMTSHDNRDNQGNIIAKIRKVTPSKQRHGGGYGSVSLLMKKDLPLLEQMAYKHQEADIPEWIHD